MENPSFMPCRRDVIIMRSFSKEKFIFGNLEGKAEDRQEHILQEIGYGIIRVRLGSMSM